MAELTSQPKRRERQRAARREQILDAAAQLFAERGFHRTTTRDIAERADVAEGTIYRFFENKNDLLLAILSRLSEGQQELAGLIPAEFLLEKTDEEDPREGLMRLLDRRRAYFQANSVMLQAILSEILADGELRRRYAEQVLAPMLDGLENDLRHHIRLGQVRSLDVPAIARVFTSMWIGLFIVQLLEEQRDQPEWERIASGIMMMLFEGISPPAGSSPGIG